VAFLDRLRIPVMAASTRHRAMTPVLP